MRVRRPPKEDTLVSDPIADLRSPNGSLISVYLNRPSPGGFSALLSDLLKPIREKSAGLSRQVEKSARQDIARITDLSEELEFDTAPAFAVFASAVDDVFVVESLAHEVENSAMIGPRPYLRPLRSAPRPLRAGVMVADRVQTRVFRVAGDHIAQLGPVLDADIGKPNYGGFSGYEEHTVRGRAEEATSRMWKEAVAFLLEAHLERPFDYLAIGSGDELVDEIARQLHPYLADIYRASFLARPQNLTDGTLRSELALLSDEVRRNRHAALAGRICDTAWSGGQAVLGLSSVLHYVNAQAVETLAVAGPFSRSGAMCNSCGYLDRSGTECPVCGSSMFAVEDVVSAAMDAVVSAGGSVFQITVPSPLDNDGIGALTRFRIEV